TVPSRALRTISRAVHAALVPGRSVGVDSATARHRAAALALVSLGVLEVVDGSGGLVLIGGPAEDAVRRARLRLDERAYGAVLDVLTPWLATAGTEHVRTRTEAFVLAAVASVGQGDRDAALTYLST